MSMKKIKVTEASNTQLDWLVAKCEGDEVVWYDKQGRPYERSNWDVDPLYKPTTNWSQMGPIIERLVMERGLVLRAWVEKSLAEASLDFPHRFSYGSTPLIAAARCYVASKLGDVVLVPDELV